MAADDRVWKTVEYQKLILAPSSSGSSRTANPLLAECIDRIEFGLLPIGGVSASVWDQIATHNHTSSWIIRGLAAAGRWRQCLCLGSKSHPQSYDFVNRKSSVSDFDVFGWILGFVISKQIYVNCVCFYRISATIVLEVNGSFNNRPADSARC